MSDPASLSPVAQAALDYARRGWRVFPCRERDDSYVNDKGQTVALAAKAPYVRQGVKEATTDLATITGWWRRWPQAMIGLAMGDDGLFALDFDPRHDLETGEEFTLDGLKAELEARIGGEVPASLAVRTPSGGVHVYLEQAADARERLRNRAGTKKSNLPQHVDVRAAGGYVILPPSYCEGGESAAEGAYRWLRGQADAAVVTAPDALVDLLLRKRDDAPADRPPTGAPRARPSGGGDDPARVAIERYGLSALSGECRAIREAGSGARNAQLNESALKIASLTVSTPFAALDEGMARAAIVAAARANPGRDDDHQLLATIASGWSAGIINPRDLAEIAAASRARRERGPPQAGSSPPAPRPDTDVNGKPSSRAGGSRLDLNKGGRGADAGADRAQIDRACAFLPHTDLGNLERFLKRFGANFLYVEQWGWLAWDGRRWNRDMAMALLGRAVQDTMRAIQDEAELVKVSGVPEPALPLWDAAQVRAHEQQQRDRLDRVVGEKKGVLTFLSDTIARWGRTSEGAGHIKCIAGMAEARLSVRPDQFDTDPLILNVANGTLVFERPAQGRPAGFSLRAHDRDDLITKIANVPYVAAARCPLYDAFLARVQPDDDMRLFLDAWGGYNMLGEAAAQKMALFYGEGANGKGVWVNTLATLLGDYSWAAAIETFIDQGRNRKGGDASPDMAAMAGRRMVYANEPEEGSKFSDGLIKAMTSDEPIGGIRELHKSPFELKVTFKNTVMANTKPRIGTDHGIQRRMQIVPWDVIIPPDERDLGLKGKLVAEGPGILNRMIAGALLYLTSGLPEPERVKEATKAYIEDNDILGQFIALCIERAPGEAIGASALHDLFAGWQTWAQLLPATGKPWSAKYLAGQMEKKGFKRRKSSTMRWDDIAARYDRTDFLDANGRPVERDLPPPRRIVGGQAVSREAYDDDDMPL